MGSRSKEGRASVTLRRGDVIDVLKSPKTAKYDLVVTSPPYNIGKVYERSANLSFEQYPSTPPSDWLCDL
jgi:site-specific DNA-methyltransferase (adenine-specific)/adenine-specific DNA-methyltransferase